MIDLMLGDTGQQPPIPQLPALALGIVIPDDRSLVAPHLQVKPGKGQAAFLEIFLGAESLGYLGIDQIQSLVTRRTVGIANNDRPLETPYLRRCQTHAALISKSLPEIIEKVGRLLHQRIYRLRLAAQAMAAETANPDAGGGHFLINFP
jgi:hypothetical protein